MRFLGFMGVKGELGGVTFFNYRTNATEATVMHRRYQLSSQIVWHINIILQEHTHMQTYIQVRPYACRLKKKIT